MKFRLRRDVCLENFILKLRAAQYKLSVKYILFPTPPALESTSAAAAAAAVWALLELQY